MDTPEKNTAISVTAEARTLIERFNKAFISHRRLPLDAEARLGRGERIHLYSGTEERWTAKLTLWIEEDGTGRHLKHTIAIASGLSPRIQAQLDAQAARF